MTEKRDCRIQVLLSARQRKEVDRVMEVTGWSATAVCRLGLAVLVRILADGRQVCKDGCVARQVLDVMTAGGFLASDLHGRSTMRQEIEDTNPPERAGKVAARSMPRAGKVRH